MGLLTFAMLEKDNFKVIKVLINLFMSEFNKDSLLGQECVIKIMKY